MPVLPRHGRGHWFNPSSAHKLKPRWPRTLLRPSNAGSTRTSGETPNRASTKAKVRRGDHHREALQDNGIESLGWTPLPGLLILRCFFSPLNRGEPQCTHLTHPKRRDPFGALITSLGGSAAETGANDHVPVRHRRASTSPNERPGSSLDAEPNARNSNTRQGIGLTAGR